MDREQDTLSERQRTTSRARRSTTRAPKPTLIPVRRVVIAAAQVNVPLPTDCSDALSRSLVFVSQKRRRPRRAQKPGKPFSEAGFRVCGGS